MGRWICKGSWWVWLGLNGVLAAAVGIVVWAGAKAQDPMPQPLPVVSFSESEYVVGEGDGSVTITVTLSQASTGTVTVDYATSDGTATSHHCIAADYVAASGTLSFAPGQTSRAVVIYILENPVCESSRTFTVTLSNPRGGSLGSPSTSAVTILDNDSCE